MSGQDITMELVEVAKEVHLISKSLNICEGLSKIISKHDNLHLHLEVINGLDYFTRYKFIMNHDMCVATYMHCR